MELGQAINIVNLYAQAQAMVESHDLIMRFIQKCFYTKILEIVQKDEIYDLFPLSEFTKKLKSIESILSENADTDACAYAYADNMTPEKIHNHFDRYFKISHGRKYIPKTLETIIGLIVAERCEIALREHISEIVNNYPIDRENIRTYVGNTDGLCKSIRYNINTIRKKQSKLQERNHLPTHKCIGMTLCALSSHGEICMICPNTYQIGI